MKLIKFTTNEKNLLKRIANIPQSSIEQRMNQFTELGILQEYHDLHIAYEDLSANETDLDAMEALKRALFIQWYAIAEPGAFSGIDNIDNDAANRVLSRVAIKLQQAETDAELILMLQMYSEVTPWYFEKYDIKKFLENASHDAEVRSKWTETLLSKRGQMGQYLISQLLQNHRPGSSMNETIDLQLRATIDQINQFLSTEQWFDFSLDYSGNGFVVLGSTDFSYWHDIEITFKNPSFYLGKFEWHTNPKQPVLSLLAGKEAHEINLRYQIEQGNHLFTFTPEDLKEKIIIAAENISFKVGRVSYDR